MVKDEPIKKNILLRETLRNNFELIKEISKCICTCKDAVMFVKPGERESYTRFLKKQYLKSLRHCPLHSGESSRQYKQEILILLDRLCNKVGKGQTEIGGKGKAKRGARKKGQKVRRQGQGCIRSRPVKNQWELNVARHYLASYVNQHYKKELLRRFMQEGKCLQSTTLSGVKGTMQTKFIDVKDFDKRVYNIDSKTLSSKCEVNNSIDADREVRRQLKAQDGHSAQQELFMQILLRTRQRSGSSREDATAYKTKDESTHGDWCSRIEQLNITEDFRSGIQRCEGSKTVGHGISYQEVFSDSNPDISYCGRVHIRGLSLSYVMENGYKFLPLKQAIRLFPWCCCSISKAVLRTHPGLVRTFSTWEHVRLLDLLSGKGNQNNVQTGDILVKLDTIITCLPDIEAEVKLRHRTKRPKKCLTCKY
ncbi:uncharacterized protein LOC124288475 [Haliotis rubra]|uniref:uncharacterized protein LOC124288475 n=1 Tax=Haliotis rubra TaxID=36100 RepID=UPI001EE57CC9|nr:uncharacterized protein LOC124288475 [Haliotis rubra]